MRRALRAGLLLAAIALASGCGSGGSSPSSGKRRNLVLVVIDTLRRDHLPFYGYDRPTAPTLTRLASEGSIADAISPTSWTKPAVATILTGLHPVRHQTFGNLDVLPEDARTLAQRLKAQGYQTLGVTANGFTGDTYGFGHGFDQYFVLPESGLGRFEPASKVNEILETRLPALRPPFFLFLHYLDPHAPYEPMGTVTALAVTGHMPRRRTPVSVVELESQSFMSRPQELLDETRDLYDGEIRRTDEAIGEVLSRLQRTGLLDTTLVVVTSDHGEEMQEHGRMGHGQTLYEEVVRVPLLLWGPGTVPAGVHHGTVSLEDVLPTTLDLLGLGKTIGDVDGEDLAPAFVAGRPIDGSRRELLLHLDSPGGHYLALRTDRRKLVIGQGPYRKEIFDVAADPGERKSLLATEEGRRAFEAMAPRLVAAYRASASRALEAARAADDKEKREALAALGYVAGTPGNRDRLIPRNVAVPDPEEGGLLGWEDVSTFETCVAPSQRPPQLLLGWHWSRHVDDRGGDWTWPEATVAFRVTAGARLRAHLEGRSPAPGPARARLSWRGQTVLDAPVDPGPVDLVVSLGVQEKTGVGLLRIEVTPGTRLAPRPGLKAGRDVGLFVRSVCVEPDRDAPADRPGGGAPQR